MLHTAIQCNDFQTGMLQYIREQFANILGSDIELLDQPDGLERILVIIQKRLAGAHSGKHHDQAVA